MRSGREDDAIGGRAMLHLTSSGKLFLAFMDAARRNALQTGRLDIVNTAVAPDECAAAVLDFIARRGSGKKK